LYEVHLNGAKAELRKAQAVIDQLDARRLEAEKLASVTKSAKRRLSQELLAREWKDEGMKEGFIQGMERARAEADAFLTMSDQITESAVLPSTNPRESSNLEGDGDSYYYTDDETTRRHSSTTDFTTFTRPETPPARDPPPAPPPAPPAQPVPPQPSHHDHRDTHEDEPPIPVPMPRSSSGDIRPIIIHNAPPSPRHPPVHIPLDGFIPVTDDSSHIVLPPSHELAPPPPITSPLPTFVPLQEDTKIIPPPGSVYINMMRPHRHHHPGSPESNSTTISQFEMVNDTFPKHSPMSAIPEVASERNSPIPSMSGAQDLHRNTSLVIHICLSSFFVLTPRFYFSAVKGQLLIHIHPIQLGHLLDRMTTVVIIQIHPI
jgi:hypothetical protein